MQGLGGALCEEFRYDEYGQPLSATLAGYALPTAREVPTVEVLVTEDAPSPLNPLGIKSVLAPVAPKSDRLTAWVKQPTADRAVAAE